jgi:predicted alpha-1,2-mannosidase
MAAARALCVRALLFLQATVLLLLVVTDVRGDTSTAGTHNLTSFVNLYIGTGGGGWGVSEVAPGPQVPFGAMRLSPDTSLGLEPIRINFLVNGGYYYFDRYVECFSHTHVNGAGGSDWQNFGVTVTRWLTDDTVKNAGYRSGFRHEEETLEVGYYGVNLDTAGTLAEVTACGTHAGMHRYSCRSRQPDAGAAEPCFLIVDICHVAVRTDAYLDFAKACKTAEIIRVEATVSGYRLTAKMFNAGGMTSLTPKGGVEVFFAMEVTAADSASLDSIPLNVSYWKDGKVQHNEQPANHTGTDSRSLGVAFGSPAPLENSSTVFTVSAAISFVSIDSALNNLRVQLAGMSFDACRLAAVGMWEAVLQQVQIGGLDALAATRRDEVVTFYTAQYHAHLSPTTYSEASGEYLGFDGEVHTVAAGTRHVSDLSLWDTYRSHGPLMVFLQPDMTRDAVNSMIAMYNQSGNGTFPIWPMASLELGLMVGHHGVIIAADAVRKGVKGLDAEVIFNAVVATVKLQNAVRLGTINYTPMEDARRSAAKTLDYALDAGCAQIFAAFMNRSDIAASFARPARAYREIWSDDQQAFCGRHANGTFDCDFMWVPYPHQHNFVEGNGGEYRWYVQHQLFELVALYKSPEYFAEELYKFFADSTLWPLNTTLPNPFFWAGNEPTFMTPFQFNWAGNEFAHLTQAWVPLLDDTYFFNGPDGVPGNDDYGAMASWLMFGYLGLYPASATNNYTLFVPRFDEVTLLVSAAGAVVTPFSNVPATGGAVLRLVAHGRPASGPAYLANVSVNGMWLTTPFVTQEQLAASGGAVAQLDFYLCSEATVFGQPAPSAGGPQPWQPSLEATDLDASRQRVERALRSLPPELREASGQRRTIV